MTVVAFFMGFCLGVSAGVLIGALLSDTPPTVGGTED
jgi:hypothetical protein